MIALAIGPRLGHAQEPAPRREISLSAIGPVAAPQWSPRGDWIAFALAKSVGIGVVRPDGSGIRIITRERGSGHRFTWAPDGSAIAYRIRRDTVERSYVVRVHDLDSGEVDEAMDVGSAGTPPHWQCGPEGFRWISHGATGRWRACPTLALPSEIWPRALAARAGQIFCDDRALTTAGGYDPVWSPSGNTVLYEATDVIATVCPTDSAPCLICPGQQPTWSASGKSIIFQITADHSHAVDDPQQHSPDTQPHAHDDRTNHQLVASDLWIIKPDGTARRPLTATPDILEVEPHASPDGRHVVCRTEAGDRLLIIPLPSGL
jgi:Tol biopolymer transport system component